MKYKEELTLQDLLDLYHALDGIEEKSELRNKIMRLRIDKLTKLAGWYKLPNGQFLKVDIMDGWLVDDNHIKIDEEELKNYKKV